MAAASYRKDFASGVICAGGTLGILIPPSIMLVVMGPVLEVPVTDLFAAAIVPGILLAFLYTAYSLIRCWLNPALGPPLPEDERLEHSGSMWLEFVAAIVVPVALFVAATAVVHTFIATAIPGDGLLHRLLAMVVYLLVYAAIFLALMRAHRWLLANRPLGFYISEVWTEFYLGLVPPALLVGFALGSILLGWATPTEGAACGAFGALLMTLVYRKMTPSRFQDALVKTLEISVLILFLVAASNFFGAVFSRLGTPTMLTNMLLSFDLSQIEVLIIVMALIFILGWPLEWVPIVLIIVPILIPLLDKMEINLTWFGILVAVNLQTAWLSPPVALSAYFLKGVVPEWDLKDIYLGMMQFMVIQLFGLALIMLFPQIVLWLPGYMYGQ
jgi:TRAP-type mannitol/chloroaromatic compound transport system permease large subunit